MVALGFGRARISVSIVVLPTRGTPSGIGGGRWYLPARSTAEGPVEAGGASSASALALALAALDDGSPALGVCDASGVDPASALEHPIAISATKRGAPRPSIETVGSSIAAAATSSSWRLACGQGVLVNMAFDSLHAFSICSASACRRCTLRRCRRLRNRQSAATDDAGRRARRDEGRGILRGALFLQLGVRFGSGAEELFADDFSAGLQQARGVRCAVVTRRRGRGAGAAARRAGRAAGRAAERAGAGARCGARAGAAVAVAVLSAAGPAVAVSTESPPWSTTTLPPHPISAAAAVKAMSRNDSLVPQNDKKAWSS